MLKKFLSRIGIGAAEVNLELSQNVFTMGDLVTGRIKIIGGEVEQKIGDISVDLLVESVYAKDEHTFKLKDVVARTVITNGMLIYPGQRLEFPFTFKIPENIPVSMINTKYYFKTNLDIKEALDSSDYDYIKIMPSGILKNFLGAFEELGFIPRKESYTGEYQIIDFYPMSWLAGQLDELTFCYNPRRANYEISGKFEIDKRNHGLIGFLADELDLDEKKGYFCFTANELATLEKARETIKNFIARNFNSLI
ncbi:sporulation protein [Carboxydocella sp. JDF658]|uniref:sporulation protein n=1 Tax=Carboxydocella sp. JDF658 TaxID=1926600 RepID=UPI0009AC76BA|nr:sporulation protein [Carboxydocella sp. JDF658]GAW30806.1 hypothetical protein JDF658_05710 [Carboxydocella sp. JDF658]